MAGGKRAEGVCLLLLPLLHATIFTFVQLGFYRHGIARGGIYQRGSTMSAAPAIYSIIGCQMSSQRKNR